MSSEPSKALESGQIASAIRRHLRHNPNDAGFLMQACAAGMNEAVEAARDRAGNYSIAMLCALGLASKRPVSAEMRENYHKLIAEKIDGPGLSQIEREFVDMASIFSSENLDVV